MKSFVKGRAGEEVGGKDLGFRAWNWIYFGSEVRWVGLGLVG